MAVKTQKIWCHGLTRWSCLIWGIGTWWMCGPLAPGKPSVRSLLQPQNGSGKSWSYFSICESCWMVWDHQDVITFDTDIYEGWWGKHLNRWACGSPACCMKRSYWILLFLNSCNIICAPNRWCFTNNSHDMGQTYPKHEGMRVWLTRQEWFLSKSHGAAKK